MARSRRTVGWRDRAAAYAELVRVPNLFTAPPDVILGAALVAGAGRTVEVDAVAGLAVASALLYAAGTTLNDAFDAPVDARERPERPIPSGRVSRTAAFAFGGVLLAAGAVVAGAATGFTGGVVAAVLAADVVLYDGVLKGTAVGFLAMGLTRGLNVVLGTAAGLPGDLTAAADAVATLPPSTVAVPAVVTVYIAAVTYMAAGETEEGGRGAVGVAAAGALLGVAGVGWWLAVTRPGAVESGLSVVLAAAFLGWVGRPLRRAFAEPGPGTIGPAVGACVLGLAILDAAFAVPAGVGWALAALAFVVPAVGLSKVFQVS